MVLNELEKEFLIDYLKSINGIGDSKARKIISLRNQFSEFSTIQLNELASIRNQSLHNTILEKIGEIDFRRPVEELYTEKVLKDYLARQYERLEELKLDDLRINVLFVKALGFTTAEEVIDYYVNQRINIGVATSWGQKALEKLCIIAGAEKIPKEENIDVKGKRFDLRKVNDNIQYYIQLKCGPNTMNVGMVDSLNKMITKLETDYPGRIGILGMTYGKSTDISTQIRNNLNDFDNRAYIGQEFWEFLSGKREYYRLLISLINDFSTNQLTRNQTFQQSVELKKEEIQREWALTYGSLGNDGLESFIQDYI